MKCPHCGLEAMIYESRTEVEGDESPTQQTQVFVRVIHHCRNPQCDKNGHEVGQVRHRVYPVLSEDRTEEVSV